jgi:hypothetical protein
MGVGGLNFLCVCEEQAWCKDDDGMEMKIKYSERVYALDRVSCV